MSEEFRDSFLGEKGYDVLRKLMKSGNDLCVDLAKCLQERSDAEAIYARAITKSSDTLQKLAGKTKGTLAKALMDMSTQASIESDVHNAIAGTLLNDISMPLKNLAEGQAKERKSVEENLVGRLKDWNSQKATDAKYRARQFEKCREIETLINKASDLSTAAKSSVRTKTSTLSSPLVLGCVLPSGRHTSASEKIDTSITKAEEELRKSEIKYHNSTRDVEIARQACATEMRRTCDQLQKMELKRITEITNFLGMYCSSIEKLSDTTYQISHELKSIQILPKNDIIALARSNTESTEIEILLYDIYAEDDRNVMEKTRRIMSLMHWMEMLQKDIATQERSKNTSYSPVRETAPEESPDDDLGSSSDGAMCSSSRTNTDTVLNVVRRKSPSSSSNDDDGAMKHVKREKRSKGEGVEKFSSEIFVDQRGICLLQELYQASLFKIEKVYNHLKKIPEPYYQYESLLTKTFNDKSSPTTFLRLPHQSSTQTPPSAPPATKVFVENMPMFPLQAAQTQRIQYCVPQQAPPEPGWNVNSNRSTPAHNISSRRSDSRPKHLRYSQVEASAPPYPIHMTRSAEFPQRRQHELVKAVYDYTPKHRDELPLKPGDLVTVLERRNDGWCKGILNNETGLFPANYVQNA